ncbi:MAG: hypothetical protein JJLCMIEE_01596 [Acidimicrobiales bacterium]|nr:hypothetical protein [Acidimicrobiales bacterium]
MTQRAEHRTHADHAGISRGETTLLLNRDLNEWCRRIAAVHHRAERLRRHSRHLTPGIRERVFRIAAEAEIGAHRLESGRSRFSLVEYSLAS